ncbi:MAG: SGNH/GDSL hydrolase family protein [Planctomycetota bacterium]|nr:MAG: SGNH/GDSL hydrolase family protein [Planctomycetota bacterium]
MRTFTKPRFSILPLVLLIFAAFATLQAEDLLELIDGQIMRGTVVEESERQVRIRVTMGGATAVLGVSMDRIQRMVIKGEERIIGAAPQEEKVEAPVTEEAMPPPLPKPLMTTSRVWQRFKEGKPQHIIIYGTSMVTERHTRIPSSLRKALEEAVGDASLVRVTERANAGEYSRWGAESLQGQVLSQRPDGVIIEFASNDSVSRINQSVDQARQNWERMITVIRAELPETDIFLFVTNPLWDRDSSGRGAGASNRPHVEDYFNMLRELAIVHQTYLIDTWHDYLDVMDPPNFRQYRSYVGDGRHPSRRGVNEITVPMILQVMQQGSADRLGKTGFQHLSPEVQERAAAIIKAQKNPTP